MKTHRQLRKSRGKGLLVLFLLLGYMLPSPRVSALSPGVPPSGSDTTITVAGIQLQFAPGSYTVSDSIYTFKDSVQIGMAPLDGATFRPMLVFSGVTTLRLRSPDSLTVNGQLGFPNPFSDSLTIGNMDVNSSWALGSFVSKGIKLAMQDSIPLFPGVLLWPGGRSMGVDSSSGESQLRFQGKIDLDVGVGDSLSVLLEGGDYLAFTLPDMKPSLSGADLVFSDSLSLAGFQFNMENVSLSFTDTGQTDSLFVNGGAISMGTDSMQLTLTLGENGKPGLVYYDGKIQSLAFSVQDSLTLFGVNFISQGLGMQYASQNESFALKGALEMKTDSLDLTLSVGSNGYETVFSNGGVDTLALAVNGQFKMFGLSFAPKNLGFIYSPKQRFYALSGEILIPSLWNLEFGFPNQGLTVSDGKVSINDLEFQIDSVNLGAFYLDSLKVKYVDTTGRSEFDVGASVRIPGFGASVAGDLDIVNDELNSFTIDFKTGGEGIPIAETGLFVNEIGVTVNNLEDVSNLQVGGTLGLYFASSDFIAASGTVLVDRNGMTLDGTCKVANGVVADGSFDLNLNWGSQNYEAKTSWNFGDVIIIDLGFDLNSQLDVYMYGDAKLQVPNWVWWIGGDEIGEADFYLQYLHHDNSNSYAAAWGEVMGITVGFKTPLDKLDFSKFGSGTAKEIKSEEQNPGSAGTTTLTTFSVDADGADTLKVFCDYGAAIAAPNLVLTFPEPGPGSVSVPGQGVTIDSSNTNSQQLMLYVTNPNTGVDTIIPGTYSLSLSTTTNFDGSDIAVSVAYDIPQPILEIKEMGQENGKGYIIYEAFSTQPLNTSMSFFLDMDNAGYDGDFMGYGDTMSAESVTDTFRFDLPFLPGPVYTYGVIGNAQTSPAHSDYIDAPVTFSYPLQVNVTFSNPELNGEPIPGVDVWLYGPDTLNDKTDMNGNAYFAQVKEATYQLVSYLGPGYTPEGDTIPVTFRSDTTKYNESFSFFQLSSVNGSVNETVPGLSDCSKGAALGGWKVNMYLDGSNGDSTVKDTLSAYSGTDGTYTLYFPPDFSGDYSLELEMQENWTHDSSDPIVYTGSVAGDSVIKTHDSFCVEEYGSISGQVFSGAYIEENCSGEDCQGLPGVTVQLYQDGTKYAEILTDSSGNYVFDSLDLAEHSYTVEAIPSDDSWHQIYPIQLYGDTAQDSLSHDAHRAISWIPYAFLMGDFDQDGIQDIAYQTDWIGVNWYKGNGNGSFGDPNLIWSPPGNEAVTYMSLAYVGNDTFPSILANWNQSDGSTLLLQATNRGGDFDTTTMQYPGSRVCSPPVGIDSFSNFYVYMLTDYEGEEVCLRNWTTGTDLYCDKQMTQWPMLAADLDGIGIQDLVLANPENDSVLILMGAAGSGNTTLLASPGATSQAVTADLDNDSFLDLILVQDSIYIWMNNRGVFVNSPSRTLPKEPGSFLCTGDMNADGLIDIMQNAGGIAYLNDGKGGFVSVNLKSESWLCGALADLTGDGYPEWITLDYGGVIYIYSNIADQPTGYQVTVEEGMEQTGLNFEFAPAQ